MATILSDLLGTAASYFKIGLNGIRLKNSSGVLHVRNAGDSAFAEVQADAVELVGASSGSTKLSVPAAAVAELVLPDSLPSNDQALVAVDVSGSVVTLGYADVATGSNQIKAQSEIVGHGTSSPAAVFTPPANAQFVEAIIDVTEAWNGTGANLTVGVAGSTSRYVGTTDLDLTIVQTYRKTLTYTEDGTPDTVNIYITPGSGASTGAAKVTILYANPG